MVSRYLSAPGIQVLKPFSKNPVIYALLVELCFRSFSIELSFFIWSPLTSLSSAFLAIALVTLGTQCAYLNLRHFSLPLVLSLIGRLILSSCLALLIITLMGLEGFLLIASSYPSYRNSALFALEYGNHPEYAAQAVLLSTFFCSVTVTISGLFG
ncbi:hypothetical protein EEL32_15865 [Brevibacillus laterosporus]|nr:AEC family transporter [Brevibacillus laterosporus]TPG69181.1 hypothetical protein EEL31_12010 [Brevibacillus laterosporus]TPG84247.1 hypothetical protein EEL32_15865 [Brevibacillus laterosporus]